MLTVNNVSYEEFGDDTDATTELAFSGAESVELAVDDRTAGIAAVSIPVDIPLNEITRLKFWQRLGTDSAPFGANVIFGMDADGDGDYEAGDLAWHIGDTHSII